MAEHDTLITDALRKIGDPAQRIADLEAELVRYSQECLEARRARHDAEAERDGLRAETERARAERDHWIRLYNRLENAVRRHDEAQEAGDFSDEVDDALHAAWRAVLKASTKCAVLAGERGDEG